MSKYLLILLWVGFMAVAAPVLGAQRQELVMGKPEQRLRPGFAILVFAPVVWMAATRGYIADTGQYLATYASMPSSFSGMGAYLDTVTKDKGFYAFSCLIKILSGGNTLIYLLVIALIQGGILIAVYRKYSPDYILSVFLFLVSSDYFSWMFNGIRQFMAVVLIFAATGWMLQKKWIPALVMILLASTMHQSALIMIPILLIVQGPAWNKRTVLFLLAALVAIAFVDQFTNILDDMMQETQYSNMVSDWTEWDDDGTNALRVVVYAVPTVLSVIGLPYIRAENDPTINFCTNMSIVSTGLYIISMFTSGIFMGRLPIYASLYNYILLPWEIDHMFTRDSARLVKIVMVAAYLGFYYYQMHLTWGFM